MCGIVGYTGKRTVKDVLLNGLKKLEYRGYDSAGIALIKGDKLLLRRCEGKLDKLAKALTKSSLTGHIGIGHTRWATHGRPTEDNAHPHTDCKNKLVVVHNGIIENFIKLKKKLESQGHVFKSETDTEVIAHLIEKYLSKTKNKNLTSAVEKATKELKGSYAIAVISTDDPDKIVVSRQFSPLIIGVGENESFIASDIPAVLEYTRKIIPLEDGDLAEISYDKIKIFAHGKKLTRRKSIVIPWDPVTAEKSGFKHFMLKEIFEQPRTIEETIRGRYSAEEGKVFFEDTALDAAFFKKIKRIYFIACGTAYHAGLVGKYFVEHLAKIPCEANLASEFRYSDPLVDSETLVIAITQSGETADTLSALKEAKRKKAKTIAICNVIGSSVTREADAIIYTRTGPEIGVASTKAFTAQLVVLYLLALFTGRTGKCLKKIMAIQHIDSMLQLPKLIKKTLFTEPKIIECAKKYFKKSDFLYLGRNLNYPIALEGALKLKEISYIHAEGYAAGEMKHGPIALIDEQMPVIVIATQSGVYEKVISNIQEVKARNGLVIALASKNNKEICKTKIDEVFFIPKCSELLLPVINTVALQLFAYHVANFRGCDIDQPRNLAKSVVVE